MLQLRLCCSLGMNVMQMVGDVGGECIWNDTAIGFSQIFGKDLYFFNKIKL